MQETIRSYSVSKYLTAVKNLIDTRVKDTWVHGVITQIQERDKMVYLSIAEFIEGDVKPQATLPLYLFRFDFNKIKLKLSALSKPFELKIELKVKLFVKGDFYVPYGKFQGRVIDIDPSYTIGELALTREAILQRLREENLLFKNKSIPFSEAPLHIGLITGEGSAAFHDFSTKLNESGFAFKITTIHAKMQGNETESTILSALGQLRQNTDLDVVCIVRGGGSKTDLNYFDSEVLCRAVANYPIPVLTGIGHEIDKCLLDQVAWQNFITPTDCAKFLIDKLSEAWQRIKDLALEIAGRIHLRIPAEQEHLRFLRENLERRISRLFIQEQEQIERYIKELKKEPSKIFQDSRLQLLRNQEGLKNGCRKILELSKKHFELQEIRLKAMDPKTILKKGYTLTLNSNGKIVKDFSLLNPGDSIITQFAQGTIHSVVQEKTETPT